MLSSIKFESVINSKAVLGCCTQQLLAVAMVLPVIAHNPKLSIVCPAVPCRSATLCVRMNNVTMVIPTEREVNYHIFMYTMYNSPAPSLRQLAAFMRTDLGFKQLEVRVLGSTVSEAPFWGGEGVAGKPG